jgi:hypothetical protein
VASPAGFEPTAPRLGILCSILLSYGDVTLLSQKLRRSETLSSDPTSVRTAMHLRSRTPERRRTSRICGYSGNFSKRCRRLSKTQRLSGPFRCCRKPPCRDAIVDDTSPVPRRPLPPWLDSAKTCSRGAAYHHGCGSVRERGREPPRGGDRGNPSSPGSRGGRVHRP